MKGLSARLDSGESQDAGSAFPWLTVGRLQGRPRSPTLIRQTTILAALSILSLAPALRAGADDPPHHVTSGPRLRGDDSPTPAFGGWAHGVLPAGDAARAGFDWFETGYPGDTRANEVLTAAGVRPFAYVNLAELTGELRAESGYTGPALRSNDRWGTVLVDVTDGSWQDWLVRRADEAYRTGSRGIKWDAATPDVPPGKTRADVNEAIASVMRRVLDQHSDLKFIFNQGFEFAAAHPEYVDAMETEGLFSARSHPAAWLQPWNDPWYWGPQFEQAKALRDRGVAVIVAEYANPSGDEARALYDAIVAQGFVPYVTSEAWDVRGRGLGVTAGW